MPTHRRTWQKSEASVADIFGARRQVLSGSCGREDITRSDSTHPRLFIESKYRESHAARTLYEETKGLARKEGKTPVVALTDKGRPGFLLCIHRDDLPAVFAEYALANPERAQEALREARAASDPGYPPGFDEAA